MTLANASKTSCFIIINNVRQVKNKDSRATVVPNNVICQDLPLFSDPLFPLFTVLSGFLEEVKLAAQNPNKMESSSTQDFNVIYCSCHSDSVIFCCSIL